MPAILPSVKIDADSTLALRKTFSGSRWIFTEGRNTFNPASHCDLAWAGALASYAHTRLAPTTCAGARVG